MTREDVMIELANFDVWNPENRKYTIDRYRKLDLPPMSRYKHQMIVGDAVNQTIKVMEHGGTKDDLIKMLEYVGVCMDAEKHQLDYKECYEDLGIAHLVEKYRAKEETEE